MISVTFTDTIEHITSSNHLYQYDKGQQIEISGLTFKDTPFIHFANKMSDFAIVIVPTVSGNKLTAPIPNSLLKEPHPIVAYIYTDDGISGQTIKTVLIPIERRIKPNDYVFKGDEAVVTLADLTAKVNAMIAEQTARFNEFLNTNEVREAIESVERMEGIVEDIEETVADTLETVEDALETVEDAIKYEVLFEKVLNTSNTGTSDMTIVSKSELSTVLESESPILIFEFEGSLIRKGIKSGSSSSEGLKIECDDSETHDLFTVDVSNGEVKTITGSVSAVATMTGVIVLSGDSTQKYYDYDLSGYSLDNIGSTYPHLIISGSSYSTTQVNGTFRIKGVTR